MDWYEIAENEAVRAWGRLSKKTDWILTRMQRKPKFKIGNLKNNENLTSHHIMYTNKKSQLLPWRSCRKAYTVHKVKN